ncbi:BREX-3 system P-loop-containing protein BrxF [Azospirillum canadense]|uniref:BREX-3 system P-loop-containing protein BrxF n=1 Tax=Azospirillum canadense TaxID=403962 RepID=UPI002227027C|nr:BREX-3 system P-loop-containing protein BrxF [Azospirillum canadense]MCW2238222.1 hypothetical protein [Azospirillum canadense]
MEAADACLHAIEEVAGLYHRLLLLVGTDPATVSDCIKNVAGRFNLPVTNLNAELAAMLLEVPSRQRQIRANKAVGDILDSTSMDMVMLDHTDLLFSPSLRLDPLALLKSLSRNKTIVAAWPGAVRGDVLMHAENWHPEYQQHPVDGVRVFSVDQQN